MLVIDRASSKDKFKKNNKVKKTVSGYCYLGRPLGPKDFTVSYLQDKIKRWKIDLESSISIARCIPYEAYTVIAKRHKH